MVFEYELQTKILQALCAILCLGRTKIQYFQLRLLQDTLSKCLVPLIIVVNSHTWDGVLSLLLNPFGCKLLKSSSFFQHGCILDFYTLQFKQNVIFICWKFNVTTNSVICTIDTLGKTYYSSCIPHFACQIRLYTSLRIRSIFNQVKKLFWKGIQHNILTKTKKMTLWT